MRWVSGAGGRRRMMAGWDAGPTPSWRWGTRGLAALALLGALVGCGFNDSEVVVPTATPPRALLIVTPTTASGVAGSPAIGVATAAAAPTIDPATLTTYVVREGETLFTIALQLGVDFELLLEINGIEDPASVQPGQEILVPVTP